MSNREPVVLQIGSQRHQGWQEVRIRLSLEQIAEAIERAAQIRGARIVSDAQGRLVIVHAVQREIRTPLELGGNIRKGSGAFSDRDRFNTYIVEGQTPGTDSWNGEDAAGPRAEATDPRVRKRRENRSFKPSGAVSQLMRRATAEVC